MYSTVSQKCNLLFFCHFSLFSNSRSQLLEKYQYTLHYSCAILLVFFVHDLRTLPFQMFLSHIMKTTCSDWIFTVHTWKRWERWPVWLLLFFFLVGLVLVLEGFLQRFFVFVLFSGLLDIHLWIFNFQSFLFSCYTFYLFCQAHCILSYFSSVFCIPFFLFFFFFSS